MLEQFLKQLVSNTQHLVRMSPRLSSCQSLFASKRLATNSVQFLACCFRKVAGRSLEKLFLLRMVKFDRDQSSGRDLDSEGSFDMESMSCNVWQLRIGNCYSVKRSFEISTLEHGVSCDSSVTELKRKLEAVAAISLSAKQRIEKKFGILAIDF
jgi:hypothetical protein